jgi:hypothetical protein
MPVAKEDFDRDGPFKKEIASLLKHVLVNLVGSSEVDLSATDTPSLTPPHKSGSSSSGMVTWIAASTSSV